MYLDAWKLKDLKVPTSKVEAPGSKEVAKLVLAEASELLASPAVLEKPETYSTATLVGDANGLSGRLCSILYQSSDTRDL